MIDVQVAISDSDVEKIVAKINQTLKAPAAALQTVAKSEAAAVQDRIRSTKIGPGGQAWAPWSMSTLRARMKDGSAGTGLLNHTGALASSMVGSATDNSVTIMPTVNYATYLQTGTRKMPARPFMGWDEAAVGRVADAFIKELLK